MILGEGLVGGGEAVKLPLIITFKQNQFNDNHENRMQITLLILSSSERTRCILFKNMWQDG